MLLTVSELLLPLLRTVGGFSLPRTAALPGWAGGGRLLLPPGYRDTDEFQFPLVLQLTGPDHHWRLSWPAYLASSKGRNISISISDRAYVVNSYKPFRSLPRY